MKVLFVGLLYNPEKEQEYLKYSRRGISVASNLYQWNLIKGLCTSGVEVEVIGSVPIGNYPEYSNILYLTDQSWIINGIPFKQIGFINCYPIKHFERERRLKAEISKWISENKNEEMKVVVFYDLYNPFIKLIKWLKKRRIKNCLIIPDLAGTLRNDIGLSKWKTQLLNHKAGILMQGASISDGFVFLTQQMNDIINEENKPYIIIDGIVDEDKDLAYQENNIRVIAYAGNLSTQYNISELISSFTKVESDRLGLWFIGKGTAENVVHNATKKDKRIKYLGFVSKDELVEIEKGITFYINPRINNGEYTKYSFPSKNLEYLLACKPVITYKLAGIGDDYDDIFLYLDEDDSESMTKEINRLLKMSDIQIKEHAIKGFEFVKKNNGYRRQGKRMATFLKELLA